MRVFSRSHTAQAVEVSCSLPIPLATRIYFCLVLFIFLFIPRTEHSATCFSVLWVTLNTKEPGIIPLLHCQCWIQSLLSSTGWSYQRRQQAASQAAGGRGRSDIWKTISIQVTSSGQCAFQKAVSAAGLCPQPSMVPTVPWRSCLSPAHASLSATMRGCHTASATKKWHKALAQPFQCPDTERDFSSLQQAGRQDLIPLLSWKLVDTLLSELFSVKN